jgi:hypothetical protein
MAHPIMMLSNSPCLFHLNFRRATTLTAYPAPNRNMHFIPTAALLLALFAGTASAQPAPPQGRSVADPPAIPPWGAQPPPAAGQPIQLSIRGVPGWFRIGVPAGWQIGADRLSGRVAVSGEGRSVRLWLVLLPQAIGAADVEPIFSVMNAQMSPKAIWSSPAFARNGSRMTIAARGRDGDVTRVAGLSLVPAGEVTVALYAIVGARHAAFEPSRNLFAAVLESFMPLPGYVGGRPGLEGISFERWVDPNERAFSLDVPKGWRAQGGTVRKAAIDVRQVVQLASPDQTVLIQFGDAQMPTFVEPADGATEEGARGPAPAMRYLPAAEFGPRYLDWRAKPLLGDLAIEEARALPELGQRLQSIQGAYATDGVVRRVDAADVRFRGTWNGRPANGYLFAATSRVAHRDGDAVWFTGDFGSLQGFVAVEDRIPTAIAVMERMRTSFEITPQWYRDNTRTVEAMARQAGETGRHVSAAVSKAFANAQPPYTSIHERFAYYKNDVVPLTDPKSGQSYRAQVGSNYYWIAERGQIVGTTTSFNPDPLWFREMLAVRP